MGPVIEEELEKEMDRRGVAEGTETQMGIEGEK